MLLLVFVLIALFLSVLALFLIITFKRSQKMDQQILKEALQMQRLLQGQLVVMGQRILAVEQATRDNDKALSESQSAGLHAGSQYGGGGTVVPRSATEGYSPQGDQEFNTSFDFAAATAVPKSNLDPAIPNECSDATDDATVLARQLLEAGEAPEVVAERCNLSQSEIDLLQAMYQPSKS